MTIFEFLIVMVGGVGVGVILHDDLLRLYHILKSRVLNRPVRLHIKVSVDADNFHAALQDAIAGLERLKKEEENNV